MNLICPRCRQNYFVPPGAASVCSKCNVGLVQQAAPPLPSIVRTPVRKRIKHSLAGVFDADFRVFAAPSIASLVYILCLALWMFQVAGAVIGAVVVVSTDMPPLFKSLYCAAVFGAAFVATIWLCLIRVALETVLVLFRCEEHLEEISSRKP